MTMSDNIVESEPLLSRAVPSTPREGSSTGSVALTPRRTASGSDSEKGVGICRICLEEDQLTNLEQPCGCTGTQLCAHHECIQKWVNEKGNKKCEICEQQYKGDYTVPEPRLPDNVIPLVGPNGTVYLTVDDLDAHNTMLDYEELRYGHQAAASGFRWFYSFFLFMMFVVVLHQTMYLSGSGSPSDKEDYEDDTDRAYADALTLLFIWLVTKVVLVALPVYTIVRLLAARRQQAAMEEHMGGEVPGRILLAGHVVRTIPVMRAPGSPSATSGVQNV